MSIRLSDERCEEIKQEVVNLFERYNINCVPISGFEIASKMGIKVMPYSSKAGEAKRLCLKESEDGFSIRRGSKWYIFYNDDKQFGRINNTMLHEIGHIVLDHTEDSEPVPRTRIREHSGYLRILFHENRSSFGKRSMGRSFLRPMPRYFFYSDRFSVQNS